MLRGLQAMERIAHWCDRRGRHFLHRSNGEAHWPPHADPRPKGHSNALAASDQESDAVVIHDALYVTLDSGDVDGKGPKKRAILIQHIAGIPFSSPLLRVVMRAANLFVTLPMLWAADKRVFISDTVQEALLGRPPRLRCELLFNGVDRTIFHPAEGETPTPSLGSMPATGGRGSFSSVAMLKKRDFTVLRALAQSRSDLVFVLVGSGPIKPSESGSPKRSRCGPQVHRSLADLYRWADMLLLLSVGEGFRSGGTGSDGVWTAGHLRRPDQPGDPGAADWLCGVSIELSAPGASAQCCSRRSIVSSCPTMIEQKWLVMRRGTTTGITWRGA